MKVSVVIPVFNEEKYIENCLTHLKKQAVKPDEIIIVDNNCTDETIEIAKQFDVRIVKELRQGITPARNKGYDSAKYEIIARCDADSLVPPQWIKRIKYNFEKKHVDALTGPLFYYDLPVKNVMPVFNTYVAMLSKIIKHYPLHGPNMALSKSIWMRVRDEVCQDDNMVHEDHDISLHIYQRGGHIHYDRYLTVRTSGRRIKHDPTTFFIEYPTRLTKMLRKHHVKLFDL